MGVHAIDVSLIYAAHLCNRGLWPTAERDIKQIKPGCLNLLNVFKQMDSKFDFYFIFLFQHHNTCLHMSQNDFSISNVTAILSY